MHIFFFLYPSVRPNISGCWSLHWATKKGLTEWVWGLLLCLFIIFTRKKKDMFKQRNSVMHPTSPVVFSSSHFSSSLPSLANPFFTYHPVPAQCPLTNKPTPTQRQKVTTLFDKRKHTQKKSPTSKTTNPPKQAQRSLARSYCLSAPPHEKSKHKREREREGRVSHVWFPDPWSSPIPYFFSPLSFLLPIQPNPILPPIQLIPPALPCTLSSPALSCLKQTPRLFSFISRMIKLNE